MVRGTDENFSVKFVYETDPPDIESVFRSCSYASEKYEGYGLEHGDIRGQLTARAPDEGGKGTTDLPRIEFSFQQIMIAKDVDYDHSHRERLDALVDVVNDVYLASDPRPAFVYGLQKPFADAISMYMDQQPVDAAALTRDGINYAVWLNVFSPRLVETYGRETLLSAPAWRTEEWDDGAILLVHDDDPLALQSVGELNEHLGLNDPKL